jgi:hypothetical protein
VSEVEAWFRKDPGRPSKAVITSGDLKLSGSPKLIGACGGAHANDDMQVSGSPVLQMTDGLTASNSNLAGGVIAERMSITGSPTVAGAVLDSFERKSTYEGSHAAVEPYDIPRINPADYAPHVATLGENGKGYILRGDGSIAAGPGISCDTAGFCAGGNVVPLLEGWSFSGGSWKVAGSSAADGIFYSEAKVEISGNVGSASLPWQATIIARDSIGISGDAHLRPYPSTPLPLQNHLLVTGNDLEISGNMIANSAAGAILVHQQIKITRDPQIAGFVIAGDGQPGWAGDPFADAALGITLNEISGSPIIDYSCQFGCRGPGCPTPIVAIAGWKQKF